MSYPRGMECGRCSEQVACLDCREKPMDFYFLFLVMAITACLLHLSQVCPSCSPKNWSAVGIMGRWCSNRFHALSVPKQEGKVNIVGLFLQFATWIL